MFVCCLQRKGDTVHVPPSITNEFFRAQDWSLGHTAVDVDDVGDLTIYTNNLGMTRQIRAEPGKRWATDTEPMKENVEQKLVVNSVEGTW